MKFFHLNYGRKKPPIVLPEEKETKSGVAKVEKEEDAVKIFLAGEIDAGNFEEIESEIRKLISESEQGVFLFDMEEVSYISSAGLRMFSNIKKALSEQKRELKLVQVRGDIFKLFRMTGYSGAIPMEMKTEE